MREDFSDPFVQNVRTFKGHSSIMRDIRIEGTN